MGKYQQECDYQAIIAKLLGANKDLQNWFDATKAELDALKSQNPAELITEGKTFVEGEDFCYCNDGISLQIVSGGGHAAGLYGCLTVKIGDEYIQYMRNGAIYARPVPAIPEGYALVPKAEFDRLMYWLDRCERKGHLDNCADLIEPYCDFCAAITETELLLNGGEK